MKVESLWTRAIWSDGKHNAFPGIARFGDHYKEDYMSRSPDGVTWSEPRLLDTAFPAPPADCGIVFTSQRKWLIRIRRGPDGAYYSIGRCGLASSGEPGVLLFRSEDGLTWKAMHTFGEGIRKVVPRGRGGGHEADIAFLESGVAVAAIRTNHQGLIAVAAPPYLPRMAPATSRQQSREHLSGASHHCAGLETDVLKGAPCVS